MCTGVHHACLESTVVIVHAHISSSTVRTIIVNTLAYSILITASGHNSNFTAALAEFS